MLLPTTATTVTRNVELPLKGVFKAPPRQVLVHHADEANKVESADHGCLIPSRYSDIPDIFIFVRLPDTEHDKQNSN